MAFKDVLALLYERALGKPDSHGNVVKNQEDFADKHLVERETMNQWLTGNRTPPPRAVWTILEKEGYSLGDCIVLPEARSAQAKYSDLFRCLETIILSGDEDRILGITINLKDIASGARASSRKRKRQTIEDAGNLSRKEKKRLEQVVGKRRTS